MEKKIVKGSNFSYNDVLLMKESHVKDLRIVFIYPSGITEEIVTSLNTFKICDNGNTDSIIY